MYSATCQTELVQWGPVSDDGVHGRAIRFVHLAGFWRTIEAQTGKDENVGQHMGEL